MKDCGVLLHISSLPSPFGIGDLGEEAYKFADALSAAGQSYWQVLPLVPTSYGDSPYQSPCSFAGNPYFIDLRTLAAEGLLTEQELAEAKRPVGQIDYGWLYDTRNKLLKKAYDRFTENKEYKEFVTQNGYWLKPYALFCVLKDKFGLKPHWEWDDGYGYNDPKVKAVARSGSREIKFIYFVQYQFNRQWQKLKSHVNSLGIKIIGDAPIYAAYDSSDFWENPLRFKVDETGKITSVAGVPPDYFSADGQLWGNPLYDWQYLRKHGYDYWVARIRRGLKLYDRLRIDHFRGFCAYYSIKAGRKNARVGRWCKGPGMALFKAIEKALGKVDVIAEDLGVDSPDLRKLLADCGYPGMKVMQFGFDGNEYDNAHATVNYTPDCLGYTGTHDNDTTLGWYDSLSPYAAENVRNRLNSDGEDIVNDIINALFATPVNTAIVPMQDWLRQGSYARVNTPGTSQGNWQYRLAELPPQSVVADMLNTAVKHKRAK